MTLHWASAMLGVTALFLVNPAYGQQHPKSEEPPMVTDQAPPPPETGLHHLEDNHLSLVETCRAICEGPEGLGRPLLGQPYADRQFIIVVDDQVLVARRRADQALATQDEYDWLRVAEVMARMLTPGAGPAGGILINVMEELISAWGQLRESGIPVVYVGRSEASQLKFPPGHPRDRVIYVAHPAVPDLYYPLAQFHRRTFEHKFSEAIKMLMNLGAAEIRVEHVAGWSTEFSSSLDISLPHSSSGAGANLDIESKRGMQLLYVARLEGTPKASIPGDLVWYNHEITWQQVADGRLRYGLQDFSLTVRYDDDYGVNAGLNLAVTKAGLDVGGKFEDHQATIWKIEGTFGSK